MKLLTVCCAVCILGGIAFAGAVDGPTDHEDTVAPGKIDVYRINFTGGKRALARSRSTSGHLDLYVYDAQDTLVGKDEGKSDVATYVWTPKATGQFKIKIVNNGPRDVNYNLETN